MKFYISKCNVTLTPTACVPIAETSARTALSWIAAQHADDVYPGRENFGGSLVDMQLRLCLVYSSDGTNVYGSRYGERWKGRWRSLKVVKSCSNPGSTSYSLFRHFCCTTYRLTTMHGILVRRTDRETDRQTDRRTERWQYDANNPSWCVQYDRLKTLLPNGDTHYLLESDHMALDIQYINKYECAMNVLWIKNKTYSAYAYREPMTSRALGELAGSRRTLLQRVAAYIVVAILKVWRHIKKSDYVDRCVFTWRTIVSNFTAIWFETTYP